MTIGAWILVLSCLVSFNIGFFAKRIAMFVLDVVGMLAGLVVAICEMAQAK